MVSENEWLIGMSRDGDTLPTQRSYNLNWVFPQCRDYILRWRRLTASVGGDIADGKLTPDNAQALFDEYWEPEDFFARDGNISVFHFDGVSEVVGVDAILALGNKLVNVFYANIFTLPEATPANITDKLDALIDLRANHGATGTPAEQAVWNYGTNAAKITNAIARLQALQGLYQALNLPEAANDQINFKLFSLQNIANTYPGGTDEEQAVWNQGTNAARVTNAIARLQVLTATPESRTLYRALNMNENNDDQITLKLNALQNIANTYPGGTDEEQAAWNYGTNAAKITNAIARLQVLATDEGQTLHQALNLPEATPVNITLKLNALQNIANTYPGGTDEEQAVWNQGTNAARVTEAIARLTALQTLHQALNLPEATPVNITAKLDALIDFRANHGATGTPEERAAWNYGTNAADVTEAIARLQVLATDEGQTLHQALNLPEATPVNITAKLNALQNIANTYPDGTDEEQAVWNQGTNAARVTEAIARLTALQTLHQALNLPEATPANITAKLDALIDLRANHGATGTPEERAAWHHSDNAEEVGGIIARLQVLTATPESRTLYRALDMSEDGNYRITAKLTALQAIANTYPDGTPARQVAWNYGTNAADVTEAIARLQDLTATDEIQALYRALDMSEDGNYRITAKLTALRNIANTYPDGTPARQAAWNYGTNAADVTEAIARLQVLATDEGQDLYQALNMNENNDDRITAKLNALQNIANTYPGGSLARRAAWNYGTNAADVTEAIARLQVLATDEGQDLYQALNMNEDDDDEITLKLTALQNIANTYPDGTLARRAAWNYGTNAADVTEAIARLQVLATDEGQDLYQALNMNEDDDDRITAKLNALRNIANTYPGGTDEEQAVWNVFFHRVNNIIARLTALQTLHQALNLPEATPANITDKLNALRNIANTYPGGTDEEQAVWNQGTNAADVTEAIARLQVLATDEGW
jgi:Mg2+/citrate symporter